MTKPTLSDNFTMDDLRALREYNSLRHINMSREEISKEFAEGRERFLKQVEEIRQEKSRLLAV